jgi:hypothetical protein
MAEPVNIPANGDVRYTYEILPTNFKEGRWVEASEILPGLRSMCITLLSTCVRPIRRGCGMRRWETVHRGDAQLS